MQDTISGGKGSKSEQTRKRIEQTYLNLIYEKKWDRITVKELCLRANITRGTFYQYYGDIYELMEQIQDSILQEISKGYKELSGQQGAAFRMDDFIEKYDCTPPPQLLFWFDFCKSHKTAMEVLLDPHNGDPYFVKKLKNILHEFIEAMMDHDGMPGDELRAFFVKIFTEMHFLSARLWLESEGEDFLSSNEVVNLLNTMRVGAGYQTYKRLTSEEFEEKIHFKSR